MSLIPVGRWSSWTCSCRGHRSPSWWETGSPTRSSLTSRLPGPRALPPPWEGWRVVVLEVPGAPHGRMSMQRMAMVSRLCEQRFLREMDDLVCADVNMTFCDHVGMEILSPLFGTLHPSFHWVSLEDFSYQCRPLSQAHIPMDQGNIYYTGAFLRGLVVEVYRLTLACHQAMGVDLADGIGVLWCDKSHLNRYLLDHKPSYPRRTCGTRSSRAALPAPHPP
ncbi:unnamed protein product [Gulo gulo]|uniref:Histo-blood group ABO system transferase-like n=1 Tax=Gulo gulo TaxID=48420 RepID=A0A9X9LS34_GULGU|nr:unnamed protein product [Gulo gulo]